MAYQYQTPPVDPAATHAARQQRLFSICDKLGEFFNGHPFSKALCGVSDIIAYVCLAVSFIVALLALILDTHTLGTTYISYLILLFSVLALGKRRILPLVCAVSYFALCYVGIFVCDIVHLAKYKATATGIFNLIFTIIELGVLSALAVLAWLEFPYSLPYRPKMAAPVYVQPMPPVQPVQPMQPAQPMQQAASAPAPAANGVCPKCGVQNAPGAGFCKSCGTKL